MALNACALLPGDAAAQLNDPFEPVNRGIYAFNTEVRHALTPIAEEAAPLGPILLGLHNVLVNLREPLVFSNDLAQGRECAAGASLRRFMVNSTLGIGGLFDVGKQFGVEAHDNDFGQTLAVWGLPPGPFLMLPVLGPSDFRGTTGTAVEYFADPVDIGLQQAAASAAILPLAGMDLADRQIDAGSDLDKLERTSLDGYAALRSAYRQNLASSIADDKCPSVLRVAPDSATRGTAADGQ
jgi:phospholipid-binding lipoprotein MlaA